MNEPTWQEQLAESEENFRGHTEYLPDNIREIEKFSENPMFDNLTDREKEGMKENLVYFINQIR